MRRLGFPGKSRLHFAQSRLPAALHEWQQAWCFTQQGEPAEVICTAESEWQDQPDTELQAWHCAQTANGKLWLAVATQASWAQLVWGEMASELPADTVAAHLLEQARLALVNTVLQALDHPPVDSLIQTTAPQSGAALSSRLVLCMPVQGRQLVLLLEADLLNAALSDVPAASPLSKRQDTLGGAKVRLQVRLPLVSLALGDVTDLQVGDVLRATTRLDQPLPLVTEAGEQVAHGYLTRTGNQLALQLVQ